jgi:regulator of sigma E protease
MSWLIVFFGFSLLVVLHEAGHFFAAKATGMRVERFSLFFGPMIASVGRGETVYGVGVIPIGGYVKISGMNPEEELPPEVEARAYCRQPTWKRIVVIAAGPAVNIVLAFAIFFFVYFSYAQQPTQKIGEVIAKTPAARVLQPGDRILAVDGRAYEGLGREARLKRFIDEIGTHECPGRQSNGCRAERPVALRIEREGAARTVLVRPEYKASARRMLIGFSYGSEPTSISVGTAASRAWGSLWLVTHRTASVFARIFESSQRKEISSVVGISDVAHQTVEKSAEDSLLLLALVSLSLGLINLLPVLPLDGGHIFWSIVEKVRGKPASLQAMERASIVGFALIAMLFFIGLSNDIGRITGEGFNTR